MKHFISLLLLLPLLLASCGQKSGAPGVEVNVAISGCAVADSVIYIVQGDVFKVDSVTIQNLSVENAVICSVVYGWDSLRVGDSVNAPYSYNFNTSSAKTGSHDFEFEAAVHAVDYPPAVATLACKAVIVASPDEIPADALPGANLKTEIKITE